MTTLALALATSPIHAAYATTSHGGTVEVRALASAAGTFGDQLAAQTTEPECLQYELRTNGEAQMRGSYAEIIAIASHLRGPDGVREPDWRPCWFPGQ